MSLLKIDTSMVKEEPQIKRHKKCKGWYDEFTGDYDCDYQSVLVCDECNYGAGRKNPEAKCNQL